MTINCGIELTNICYHDNERATVYDMGRDDLPNMSTLAFSSQVCAYVSGKSSLLMLHINIITDINYKHVCM